MNYNYLYSFKVEDGVKYVCFKDNNLIEFLQIYFQDKDMFRDPVLSAKELFSILNNLKVAYGSYIPELINWIEKECQSEINLFRTIFDRGFINFDDLYQLFPIDQYVTRKVDETIIGEKVTEIKKYSNDINGIDNSCFVIISEAIDSNGHSFVCRKLNYTINFWKGLRKIDELPIIPLLKNDEIYDKLVIRGKKFIKYAIGYHFLQLSAESHKKGRVMVDVFRYKNKCGNYTITRSYQVEKEINNVKEEELFICQPKLPVFNFMWKRWDMVNVNLLNEISFDNNAFDKLIFDQTKKSLIESLVKFDYNKTDFITGKGDGCTFLLHGPSGVGKTLTAEAISEMLHRPLYSINVGELGTQADLLEKNLKDIFDMTLAWNAIVLIDEADIFLERRNAHEVKRNALVCVFLKLLDYHQGIIFLTTNRANNLDDAFQSRISVTLEYKELDAKGREKLWNTFLEFSDNPTNVDIKKLSEKHLNGREIRNAVKLAIALNKEKNEAITTELLEKVLNISSNKKFENIAEGNKRKAGISDQDLPNSKRNK